MGRKMKKQVRTYVTFGQTHHHEINNKMFDEDCVALIIADTYIQGREKAFKIFGNKFSNAYPEQGWLDTNLQYYPRGYIYVD